MPIPDYQTAMLPLLRYAGDGQEHKFRDAVEALAPQFELTEQERGELLPSGGSLLFDNRVGWARTYLKQAGLLESPKRGLMRITQRGLDVLRQAPVRVDLAFLEQFAEFREFKTRKRDSQAAEQDSQSPRAQQDAAMTPEDQLAVAYRRLRDTLESDLLEQVKSSSPAFFERLVIDLLLAMGYGGSRRDAGRAIGRSGDGGIDGIIKEDKLGLDAIYVQAKRWEATVGRPEVQKFAGALQGHRANKGVFITTSNYSAEALSFVGMISSKIILIDGPTLAGLMIDHGVGVSTVGTYEIRKIDADYFEGD